MPRSKLANIVCSILLGMLLIITCPRPVSLGDTYIYTVSTSPECCATTVSRSLPHQPLPALHEPIVFVVTAYTLSDLGMPLHGLTAQGTRPRPWYTAAADVDLIPLGTRLYIPALADTPSGGWFVVEDTGGAVRGYSLDLYFDSRAEALRFGRRRLEVYIY